MQITAILATALAGFAVTNAAGGFKVPRDQPDGVYLVTANPDGSHNHTLLDTPAVNPVRRGTGNAFAPKRRQATDFDQPECQSSDHLNAHDTDAANAALTAQCNAHVGADNLNHRSIYSIVNGVTAYFCFDGVSFGSTPPKGGFQCYGADHTRANSLISQWCGNYVAGSIGFQVGFEYGYKVKGGEDHLCESSGF